MNPNPFCSGLFTCKICKRQLRCNAATDSRLQDASRCPYTFTTHLHFNAFRNLLQKMHFRNLSQQALYCATLEELAPDCAKKEHRIVIFNIIMCLPNIRMLFLIFLCQKIVRVVFSRVVKNNFRYLLSRSVGMKFVSTLLRELTLSALHFVPLTYQNSSIPTK